MWDLLSRSYIALLKLASPWYGCALSTASTMVRLLSLKHVINYLIGWYTKYSQNCPKLREARESRWYLPIDVNIILSKYIHRGFGFGYILYIFNVGSLILFFSRKWGLVNGTVQQYQGSKAYDQAKIKRQILLFSWRIFYL